MNNYQDFQNSISSEKVVLAIIEGAKRLIAFSLYSGSTYYLSNFNVALISSIKSSGVELTEVASLDLIEDDTYYNDRDNQKLYLKLSSDQNPNSQFLVLVAKHFFSNRPCALPWDLSSGFEVYFEPMIKTTSYFGVELDIVNEATSAIEGEGSITFHNDHDFWPKSYDKIFFENQLCSIYSWNPEIKAEEAKLLFRGFVDSKSYSTDEITLSLKDLMNQLKANVSLSNIEDLGLRNDPALNQAKQRALWGKVQGHRPVNLDKLINNSYPITGTISVFFGETSVVGTGTRFKKELISNDKLKINDVEYPIARITSDTTLELTGAYSTVTQGNLKVEVIPSSNKNYMNREWLIAGHALSQPKKFIQHGSTTSRLILDSTTDLYDGDDLYIGEIGSGELVRIDKVINSKIVTLAQSTEIIYPADTELHRPCIQNVRLNDLELVYLTDYTVDPNSARLLLNENAEENRSPLLESADLITVTSGNNYFTGSGTKFRSYINPGYKVRPQSTSDFYTVLSVDDTQITLTEDYTGPSFTTATALPEKTSISGLSSFREKYFFRAVTAYSDLQGKYFKIWDDEGSVAVWFNLGNVGHPEPSHNCNRSIEIPTVNVNDNKYTVLRKIAQKLNADEKFSCEITSDTMIIENKIMGVRPAALNTNTEFSVLSRVSNEQRVICVADIADSLDGKYFTLYDNSGTVAFWFDIDNNGTIEPNHGCNRSVKISTVIMDDSATIVRDKVKAIVEADSAFTTANYNADGFIATCTMVSASIGSMPAGFEISVDQLGKSAWDLNGKYFVLPHHYSGADRTAGFWFDIDNNGTSAPSTGATANTEISTVNSEFTEEEIFEAISDVIEAHANFTSEYSENSILVTDVASEDVSTTLNVGTSGLTIVQTQAGVTSNPLNGKLLQFKNYVFGDSDVLSCDVLGKTLDGNPESRMIKTAPEIVRDLLISAGLQSYINEASFIEAQAHFGEELSLCVPRTFNDKAPKITFRSVINDVNNSVLGMLLQSNIFELEYAALRPRVSSSMPYYSESDILKFKMESTNKNMVKQTVVEYGFKEYDYSSKSDLISSVSQSSDVSQYILITEKVRTYNSLCVNEVDAQRLANRWAFLLEYSSNSLIFRTKLSASQLQINDVIQISHRKFYKRLGGLGTVKLAIIEKISKNGDSVEITAIDLSNAFNRVAKISDTELSFENSEEQARLVSGYYSDDDGLINNEEDSFYINKIW